MPLTTKFIADCIDMMDEQLYKIPVDERDDFDLICGALQNILTPNSGYIVPEKLTERMLHINDYLTSPEDYVADESDYAEYIGIIKDRISRKIIEFNSLGIEEKSTYVQEQIARKTLAAQTQLTLSTHHAPEPGSAAHVITEEELLAIMQADFSAEREANAERYISILAELQNLVVSSTFPYETYDFTYSSPVFININNVARTLVLSMDYPGFTAADIAEMNLYDIWAFFQHDSLIALADGVFTVTELTALTRGGIPILLQSPGGISALRNGLFSMANLAELNLRSMMILMKPSCLLALSEGLLTTPEILNMPVHRFSRLVSDYLPRVECTQALRDGLFTATDLGEMHKKCVHLLLQVDCLTALQEGRVTMEILKSMDETALSTAIRDNEYPGSAVPKM